MKVYLDNAATTPIRKEVAEHMFEILQNDFGNPSSTHSYGRHAKSIIEQSRKSIAKHINCQAQEIIFTSSATEGTNWILRECVENLGVKRILTTKIEHHATLYTVQKLEQKFNIEVVYIPILPSGHIDYSFFETAIQEPIKTLVSLVHVNNEIGTVLDIHKIGLLCQLNQALFHCDAVQSMGKMELNLQNVYIDFLVTTAHKFHGPKGIGFAYINKRNLLSPMLFGGEQEKGLRASTEATHQIAGMAKALEISYQNLIFEKTQISDLKDYCINLLNKNFNSININGNESFYNILNITLPLSKDKTSMILFHLDMKGIAVSRGSACQSGSSKPSHVLAEILSEELQQLPSLRISFSHLNTKEEIDYFVDQLKNI